MKDNETNENQTINKITFELERLIVRLITQHRRTIEVEKQLARRRNEIKKDRHFQITFSDDEEDEKNV